VSFATSGPHSRTTQFFINYGDNSNLDDMGFSPFGKVIEGMEVVDKFYSGYGEGAPRGRGPSQERITAEGNAYLEKSFPKLDYIKEARIVEAGAEEAGDKPEESSEADGDPPAAPAAGDPATAEEDPAPAQP
jgi:cyclophilin family peptidyl-prolyl cis-trans isomerase